MKQQNPNNLSPQTGGNKSKRNPNYVRLWIRQRETILDIDPIFILLEIKFLHNKPPNLQILMHKRKNLRIPFPIRMNIEPNFQIPSRRSTTRLFLLLLPSKLRFAGGRVRAGRGTLGCSLSEKGNPIPLAGERIPNSILPARIPTIVRASMRSRRRNSAFS
jgi:hypothetical protein